MNSLAKNIVAVIVGIFIGSAVNMGLILISGSIIPPPNGADVTTADGLKSSMHLFEPKHFIVPFLAHALGTFVGAVVTALVAATRRLKLALVIGGIFLIGGIANILILPSPIWYSALDIIVAYIPFAYLAGVIVVNRSNKARNI